MSSASDSDDFGTDTSGSDGGHNNATFAAMHERHGKPLFRKFYRGAAQPDSRELRVCESPSEAAAASHRKRPHNS
jgi:hypothetical protein